MCVTFIYTKNNKYVYVFIHTSSPWQIFPIACPFVVTRHQNMHRCIQHTRIGFNDTRRGGYRWLVRMFGVSCRCLSALQLAYLFACNRAPRLVAALASERWAHLNKHSTRAACLGGPVQAGGSSGWCAPTSSCKRGSGRRRQRANVLSARSAKVQSHNLLPIVCPVPRRSHRRGLLAVSARCVWCYRVLSFRCRWWIIRAWFRMNVDWRCCANGYELIGRIRSGRSA